MNCLFVFRSFLQFSCSYWPFGWSFLHALIHSDIFFLITLYIHFSFISTNLLPIQCKNLYLREVVKAVEFHRLNYEIFLSLTGCSNADISEDYIVLKKSNDSFFQQQSTTIWSLFLLLLYFCWKVVICLKGLRVFNPLYYILVMIVIFNSNKIQNNQ